MQESESELGNAQGQVKAPFFLLWSISSRDFLTYVLKEVDPAETLEVVS